MFVRIAVPIMVVLLAGTVGVGCARMMAGSQTPSENVALMEGAEANHPAFIDGDFKTTGESTFPQASGERVLGAATPPSEAYVLLPTTRTVSRVVVHSSDIQGFDILISDPAQGWRLVEKVDGVKGPVINVRLKGITHTNGVKLRIRKSAGDAELRRKNVARSGGGIFTLGDTRAAAKIGEIQLLGPATGATAEDKESPEPAKSATDEELSNILMEGLKK